MPLTVAQLVARLSADTSGFYRSMAVANASMIRTGSIISRVAAGSGIALAAMGFISLRAAGNYQQSMNILEAVSNATKKQMAAMGKEAIDLGADIKLPNVSAKDAADAMTELGKAGLSVKQIMGATRGTLQLGLAANIGFADSAVIVSRALKAFNLDGTQANKVANLLAAGANASTAEITDLAYGMQNSSSQFQMAGYSIDDMVVALSALVDRGLSGEMTGTALKTMIQRLQNPTKNAAAEMKTLGVNIADAGGHMLPLPAIVAQFSKGFEKLNPLQRQQALNTIFGTRASQAMGKLVQVGAKGWDEYAKKIVGTNAAQKMTEARTKGLNGAMQGLGSQVETLAINLGMAMVPAATKAVRAMSNFVAAIDPNAIIGFFSAIKDGVVWFVKLVNGSDLLRGALVALGAGLVAYKVIVTTVTAVTKAWAIVQGVLNAVMSANPIVLIIAALVALGVALYYAYTHSETFRNIVNEAFAAIKAAAQWVVEAAETVWKALTHAYEVSAPVLRVLAAMVEMYFRLIWDYTKMVWGMVYDYIRAVWRIISTVVEQELNVIVAVIKAVWNVISAVTRAAWNLISAIITNVLDVIHGKISVFTAIKNILSVLWDGIKSVASAAWNGIKSVIGTALTAIGTVISTFFTTVYQLALDLGKHLAKGILDGIGDLAGNVGKKIKDGIGGGISWAWHHVGSTGEEVMFGHGQALGRGIIMGWLTGSADLPAKLSAKLKAALDAGKREIDAAKSKYQDAFSRLGDYAMRAFDAATAAHLGPAGTLLKQMQAEHDAAALQKTYSDAQKAVMDAQRAVSDAASKTYDTETEKNAAIVAAQADLNSAIDSLQEAGYQITISNLQKQADAEQVQWQAQRDLQKQHLQDQLADLEAALMQHPEKWKFYQDKIITLLGGYGINYKTSGKALGNAFAQGLKEAEAGIYAEARRIAAKVAAILKLGSPAKEGPMSDLDTWWTPFASTILKGLNVGQIQDALSSIMPPSLQGGYAIGGGGVLGTSTGGASGPVYVSQYYVSGSLISEAELDNRIRSGITTEAGRGRVIAT